MPARAGRVQMPCASAYGLSEIVLLVEMQVKRQPRSLSTHPGNQEVSWIVVVISPHSLTRIGEQNGASLCSRLLATVDFRQSIQAIQTVVRTIRLPLPKISSVARLPRKIV